MRWRVLALLLAVPAAAGAQQDSVRTPAPAAPTGPARRNLPSLNADTTQRPRAPGDTTAKDTTKGPRELVKWIDPDSVTQALLSRQGYTATRYQGHQAELDAVHKEITLKSDSMQSAVSREATLMVGDTIVYSDSNRNVRATGDTIVLRDPSQNNADVIAIGAMTYDLMRHRGVLRNFSTAVEQGQKWYIYSDIGAVQQDTSGKRQNVFYARDGSITSCDLVEPHYHFQAKEIKMISQRLIVARPAILYIADIPVMWLPFMFQDPRRGRRSGILPPRFGLTDVIRTTSGYRRAVENVGYYFAINDYMDAEASLDWRSGAEPTPGDPGYIRYNGEWRYRWLDRFITGAMRVSYDDEYDGSSNLSLNLVHDQQFSQNSRLNANLAYQSNTFVQQQNAFTVAQALAAISSQLNFQQQLGFANISIGGTRKQYAGRTEVDQDFPTLSLVPRSPVNLAKWLVWSPSIAVSNSEQQHIDQNTTGFLYNYSIGPGGALDSARIDANQRNSSLSFDTPFRIAGFEWRNSFHATDLEQDFPSAFALTDFNTGTPLGTRVYSKTFNTSVDWQTGIALPAFLQGTWNVSPSVSINNVDPGAYWVRTHLSNGVFVSQSKRLSFAISSSPTLYGFFPGFGPFSRLRQSIQPSITVTYAPAGTVSDDYLKALGRTRFGYLGGLSEGQLSLGLNTTIEAKVRTKSDTNPEAGQKLKLLSLNLSPLSYDFARAAQSGASGFTTSTFTYTATSDLLPGFNLAVNYSLFQGDPLSDTAKFSPYRTGVSASLALGRKRNPFTVLRTLFGGKPSSRDSALAGNPAAGAGVSGGSIYQQPLTAGGSNSRYPMGVNSTEGWTLTLNFSAQRQRPFVGGNGATFDPSAVCRAHYTGIQLDQCIEITRSSSGVDTLPSTVAGQIPVRYPATATLRGDISFHFTPLWAMQWGTGFDFEQGRFSDHYVTLQRELHDWRAIFSFTRAPNGNFAFHFFINLIAEPQLKFDYDKSTYRNNVAP